MQQVGKAVVVLVLAVHVKIGWFHLDLIGFALLVCQRIPVLMEQLIA